MPVIKNPLLRERNAVLFFGCSEEECVRLNLGVPLRTRGSYAQRYLFQRQAAFKRGIGWEITFHDWLAIWCESGKWGLRGRGKGHFCMARHGDLGPYKVGNVSIQLVTDNSRDGIKKAHQANRGKSRAGCGRGWTYRPGHKKPFQVVVGHKYIGVYATQQSAEDAYRIASESHRRASIC